MAKHTAYYDRGAGIVYVTVLPRNRRKRRSLIERSDERSWGLIDHDAADEVVGVEIWRPLEMLPSDLLDALPPPTRSRWERIAWPISDLWNRLLWQLWHRRRQGRWLETMEVVDDGPMRWYRGLPAPPDDPAELEEYRRRHPDINV